MNEHVQPTEYGWDCDRPVRGRAAARLPNKCLSDARHVAGGYADEVGMIVRQHPDTEWEVGAYQLETVTCETQFHCSGQSDPLDGATCAGLAFGAGDIVVNAERLLDVGLPAVLAKLWRETLADPRTDTGLPKAEIRPQELQERVQRRLEAFTQGYTLFDRAVTAAAHHASITEAFFEAKAGGVPEDIRPLAEDTSPSGSLVYCEEDLALVVNDFIDRVERSHEGYVIGVDDTEAAVFTHLIDVSSVECAEEMGRGKIYQAMGFERHYRPPPAPDGGYYEFAGGMPDEFDPKPLRTIRVQGDFTAEVLASRTTFTDSPHDLSAALNAVEAPPLEENEHSAGDDLFSVGVYPRTATFEEFVEHITSTGAELSTEVVRREAGSSITHTHFVVNNHLCKLEQGTVVAGNATTQPPVDVFTPPGGSTLHIAHDEHRPVTAELVGGVWRFGLLDRGIQGTEWPD